LGYIDSVGGDQSSTKKFICLSITFFAIVSAAPPGISVSQYRLLDIDFKQLICNFIYLKFLYIYEFGQPAVHRGKHQLLLQ